MNIMHIVFGRLTPKFNVMTIGKTRLVMTGFNKVSWKLYGFSMKKFPRKFKLAI